ncbi:metal-dependent hydrolase [Halobellus rarus]|uniref:Metal-dependent hydrolase n=1 Tax=Halobellus rarus TaxID=1126237 RepID=A0ABD6CKP7_9EURY|nr:metal-dependent hydrolase [Halobellus rarus]
MFVGHEFLAFALAGWGARLTGADRGTALRLGGIAALAALLPDLDVVYASATYAVAVWAGAPFGWEAFWGVANGVHRVVTHPLPVGVVAALVFTAAAALVRGDAQAVRGHAASSRLPRVHARNALGTVFVALIAAVGIAALLLVFWGGVSQTAATVAAAYLSVVGVAGALVSRRANATAASLAAAAGVGFLTHPFGDIFLAAPPPLLSPFGPPLLTERISLATDPTVEILAILFVELATVWLGIAVASRVGAGEFVGIDQGLSGLRDVIGIRSAAGVAYGAAVFVLPRPTITDAHLLGFTIVPLAVAVGLWAGRSNDRPPSAPGPSSPAPLGVGRRRAGATIGALTGLTALTLAALAYLVVYLLSS